MALTNKINIRETTTTSGTGSLALAGSPGGRYRTVVSAIGTGNQMFYLLNDGNGLQWEAGIGTVTAGSPDTFARTTITDSSDGGAAINLSANTHTLSCMNLPGHSTALDMHGQAITNCPSISSPVGLQTDVIDGSALIEMASSAPGFTAGTGTTGFTLDFDSAAEEAAIIRWHPRKAWDAGTIQVKINFTQATTAAGSVAWRIDASAISDGEAFSSPTYGTSQVVTKTAGTASTRYQTAASAAITVGNTPSKGDMVILRITREVANGSDTLAQDAKLISVEIMYSTDAATDA